MQAIRRSTAAIARILSTRHSPSVAPDDKATLGRAPTANGSDNPETCESTKSQRRRLTPTGNGIAPGSSDDEPEPADEGPVAQLDRGKQPAADDSASKLARIRALLRECRARYTPLLQNSPNAVLFADVDGKVLSANPATKRILGFSPSKLLGKNIKQLIPPSQVSHPLDLELLIKAPGESISIRKEANLLCRSGKSITTEVRVDEVSGSSRCKYMIQILPTNEAGRAAELLKKARAAARASRRERNETLAAMSHELRTPLHGLIATLDMLRDEPLSRDGARQLGVARTSARSLLKLVNDVLDISRAEGTQFPLDSKPFNLTPLIRETIDEFSARASIKGIELKHQIRGPLPRSHIGDRQRVKQILVNLVSNAIKFTSYGGVTVSVEGSKGVLVIDVADTGPGIPTELSQSIFEPFVQLKSDSSAASGTGLGLTISRQLCRAMGGDLRLLKTSPAGSTFRAMIALEESDEYAPEDRSNRVYMNPAGKILIVEDHEINQYVVKTMLESLQCSVTIAPNGREALDTLREEQFDLVLMDCRMPVLDGYETTRRARTDLGVKTPIIAMTANAGEEERSACIDAGMNDFLPKPFGRAELNRILCKWLDPKMRKTIEKRDEPILLDEDVFDELWESLNWNASALRSICESFSQTVDECALSVLASDDEDIAQQLHKLIGTSGMIGAREVWRIAAKMQESFKAGRRGDLPELVTRLRAAGKGFISAFQERLQQKLD